VTVVGIVVLFLGLVIAGAGAGLALFERVAPRGTLRLMGLGVVLAAVGLLVTILTADEGESLEAGTFVPLIIVVAIVAYAAWFARRSGSEAGTGPTGPGSAPGTGPEPGARSEPGAGPGSAPEASSRPARRPGRRR
jgi:hypothetical protein